VITRILLILSLVIVVTHRFFYMGDYAATWDQVDFALALDRFDLRMMQPHFPGYPIFIWGGMIVRMWVEDPVQALVIFNKVMIGLSAIPMFLIARRYFAIHFSLLFVLFLQTLPYLNVLSSLPMSEAAAISMLWWFFWTVRMAVEKNTFFYQILPLFVYSLLLGIRLSYIAFGVAIIILWILYWKRSTDKNITIKLTGLFFLAIMFQLGWVSALVTSEGGLQEFIGLALSFTGGHFTEWGGAITEVQTPLLTRLWLLIQHNLVWIGIAGKSAILLAILLVGPILLTLTTGYKGTSLKRDQRTFYYLLMVSAVSYFIWVLFAQNIDKPRHIAPLVICIAFWFSIKIDRIKQVNAKWFVMAVVIAYQFFLGYSLMKEQEETLPATYQLVQYIDNKQEPIIVFAWEETRIMDYLQADFSYQRIWTYERFLQTIRDYDKRTVYVTGHVLEGFKQQGISIEGSIEKEAEFFSNDLFEPVYHHIILYKWNKKD
jgi:hypothetical protein